LRTAWVFGEFGDNFVKTMLHLASKREMLGIVGDQWGSPTSAKGIAACCMKICEKIKNSKNSIAWGTYHYSGLPYINWHGFANIIFTQAESVELIKKKPELHMIDSSAFPTAAKRPLNSRLDCRKLYSQFGIQPDEWVAQLTLVLKALK
jgi:dTDP-4-dehydrorhamnose reductase